MKIIANKFGSYIKLSYICTVKQLNTYTMKLKSAFSYCLFLVVLFGVITFGVQDFLKPFFGACTIVFLMILPACSTTR